MKKIDKRIMQCLTAFGILLSAHSHSIAQTSILYGTVKDSLGKPVGQALIHISTDNHLNVSDSSGHYTLTIKPGTYKIMVGKIGYQAVSKQLTLSGNETIRLDIVLIPKRNMITEITVRSMTKMNGMGRLGEVHEGIIYSGKKNEVIILDSLNANTAQNNPRQAFGRVPGSNYSETEGSGFPSNGIGFRGLKPTQSAEIDTRQNGYNIAGDIYGYPESYYLPPLEAISRIEIIRGASSLQFGPQFGGVVNYIVKSGDVTKPFQFSTDQKGGSFGMINSFNAMGGAWHKWSYYAFTEYSYVNGWRPNSDAQQLTGFAKLEYLANKRFKLGIEYSLLRNRVHMPGGLDDAQFNQDPSRSFRARNWLTTPWNILALTGEYKVTDKTAIMLKSAINLSARDIVWRNEDGGPQTPDSISTLTNTYSPREVEHEGFRSSTTEVRLLTQYVIGRTTQVLAGGLRFFDGSMNRQGGGLGSTGSDFNLAHTGAFRYDLNFTTLNLAAFIENTFHIGSRLSVTPGFRFEYIKSTARGYVTNDYDSSIAVDERKPRYIPLAGVGLQLKALANTNIYANVSQAYRPIEYSFQYPLGLNVNAKIDKNLKDINGYNADFGWRGTIRNYLNFDVGGFYMVYNNDIAIESQKDTHGNPYTFETNVANAIHKGIESYVELNITGFIIPRAKAGALSFFNSFAYDDARYVNGLYKGNRAEFAPEKIERIGITYSIRGFSTTYLISSTSKSFADANNTVYRTDGEVGVIPAYQVTDWSANIKIKNYHIKLGVNNLANAKYFTLRTNEYPGPGIIPSIGRSWYAGFGATF